MICSARSIHAACRIETLEARLMLRPDPVAGDHVLFRLPLASDTSVHYYFDRNPAAGAVLAWNGTTQSYDGHRGSDYSGGPRGKPIYAAAPGILVAKDDGWPDMGGPAAGNYVRISHGNDRNGNPIHTNYLHFNAGTTTTKPIGSFIAAGEVVGGVGTSGNSTGLHLHFGFLHGGDAYDPYRAVGSSETSWWVNQGSGAPSTQALPNKLAPGDLAEVYELTTSNLNVRAPNPTSGSIGTRINGDVGTVLEGPVWAAFNNNWSSSLWVWYRIRWSDGIEGWSAQNWLRLKPDTVPPAVEQSDFGYQTAPHQITFRFSENVAASLQPSDLVVRETTTQASIIVTGVTFDATTNTASFTLNGAVPDGNYRATLSGAGVTDVAGNPLGEDHLHDFFFLRGDANHDGTVNLRDFNILAANFGQTDRTFDQGDFNYDGVVDLQDFNLLAARFGQSLTPSSASRSFGLTSFMGDDAADADDDQIALLL